MPRPYPVPPDEEERLQALRSYGILDTAEEQEFNDIVSLAAAVCDVPIALVSLVDQNRQWFKARVGLDQAETSRDVSFCAHAIVGTDLLEVEDATAEDRFRDNPLVTKDPNIRFYAGVPLVPDGEHPFGTLCVIDRERRTLSASQRAALQSLARQASALIELRRVNADLTRLAEQKNAFLRMVGHDLRNPLNYVLGASTLLAEMVQPGQPASEDASELIEQLPERARYMTNIINTFLDVQAIEDGGIRLEKRSVDPTELAREVVQDNERYALFKGVRLSVESADVPAPMQADPSRLRQILENLLSNAIKFSERGAVRVRVAGEKESIVIEVIDSGPGIPSTDQSRLFVPYAELTTRAVGGEQSRGLGLSICKFLAELHDGTISAANHPDGGAVFTVRLPATPAPR